MHCDEAHAGLDGGQDLHLPPIVVRVGVAAVLVVALVGVAQFLHTEFGIGVSPFELASTIRG